MIVRCIHEVMGCTGLSRIVKCRRYKDVSVPWAEYDKSRSSEVKRILDMSELFEELDKLVRRREFKLSRLVILLLFKIFFR